MKTGILTQPLLNNYGGILQAYALQTVIKRMGHEVLTLDVQNKDEGGKRIASFLSYLKRFLLRIINLKFKNLFLWGGTNPNIIISRNTRRFVKKNISVTEEIISKRGFLQVAKKENFDAFIVGSDQVWRPAYTLFLTDYFLDFLGEDKSVKRISYAASFGVDRWEFSENETKLCRELIKKFHAVSVREESGVGLCEKFLGVKAKHVLDPTFLLNKDDYFALIKGRKKLNPDNYLAAYLLDLTPEKTAIAKHISDAYNLKVVTVNPGMNFKDAGEKNLKKCIYPEVEAWLSNFFNAQFIVTDSFHGVVFSILFEKQFICIGNRKRGLSRFSSLLSKLKLEDRLIFDLNDINPEGIRQINFENILPVLAEEKEKSMKFLTDALSEKY